MLLKSDNDICVLLVVMSLYLHNKVDCGGECIYGPSPWEQAMHRNGYFVLTSLNRVYGVLVMYMPMEGGGSPAHYLVI